MINFIVNILSVPPLRYPEKWKPAFLAMQLGFIAGDLSESIIGQQYSWQFTCLRITYGDVFYLFRTRA